MTKRLTDIDLPSRNAHYCSVILTMDMTKKYMRKIAQMFQVEIQGYTYVKIDCV